ncbi:acetyltransferase [uncultured Fibrobacter sp.]|mgnify:CR=1 FL=1|uniref:acetyltransferase n=1 Tax=uncultured Fibrobacter sp. TaxID=261512 RepID=UPI00260560F1|nr:acetyltransferase [uncultured Fibrobacter sp.]
MKKIYIVGAGGFGRELLWWIKDINKVAPTWEIGGFLDDNLHALDEYECDYKVVGTIKDWQPKEDEEFALALGSSVLKRKIVEIMKTKGAKFASIIHPTAMLSEFAQYGEGFIMFPYSKLSANSTVGDFVTLLSTPIGHDTIIGDYSVISGNCSVVRNVVIGKDVFLAAGVCIAQDIHIGDGAYLGLGSVVLKDVPAGAKVFGNPARILPQTK